MNTNPLVSIVIPHFNRATLLEQTLQSIKLQHYENWEVLVVDDGSEDKEWAAAQQLAAVRICILRRTDGIKGPSRCRNLGAAAAKGDYIVFLDSDDIMAPWCLSQRMALVEEGAITDLWVFPVLLFRETPGDLALCWNKLEGDDDLARFLRPDPPWHTSSPLWRREKFLELGGFNEKVFGWDDADLHIKALLAKSRYTKYSACIPDVFIRRGEETRITNSDSDFAIELRLARLVEGTKLLRRFNASANQSGLWEGRYFVECEELLFNVRDPKWDILEIIDAWVTIYRPSALRTWFVRSYFRAGLYFRDRLYLVLRLLRRLAMMALPGEYFPSGGYFHTWQIGEQCAEQVKQKLRDNLETRKLDSSDSDAAGIEPEAGL